MNKGTPADPPYRDEPEQDAVLHTFARAGFRYDGQSLWKASLYTDELLALAAALATKPAEQPTAERLRAQGINPETFLPRHPTESAGKSPAEPMTLAEQVKDAQSAITSWSPEYARAFESPSETQRSSNANGSDEQTSPSVQPPAPEPRLSLWRHVKTGALYEILAHAKMENNGEPVVVYRGESGTWVRDAAQFYDGRFEIATPPSIAQRGAQEPITFDDIRAGAWRPGGNERVDAQRGAALTDTEIVKWCEEEALQVYSIGDVPGQWEAVIRKAYAARALSPERPEPPAPSTTGEKP